MLAPVPLPPVWQDVPAPCAIERAVLHPDGGGHAFGRAVSLSGSRAAVGGHGPLIGAGVLVFVERDDGWVQEVLLQGAEQELFGAAVLLDGERLLVGATASFRPDGVRTGSLHVFERLAGAWRLAAQLFPDVGGDHDRFGSAIAASGERLLVGAPGSSDLGSEAGAAFVFRRDPLAAQGWVQEARLLPDQPPFPGSLFGKGVALEGDTALVGAPGRARVVAYARDAAGWSVVQRLAGEPGSHYGAALALRGARALVGAPLQGGAGPRGAGIVLERGPGGWAETATVWQSTSSQMALGDSVALGDDVLALGSLGYLGVYPSHGTWIARREGAGWGEPVPILPTGSTAHLPLGTRVALDGERLLVGEQGFPAPHEDAFVFEIGSVRDGKVLERSGAGNALALRARPVAPGSTLALEIGPFATPAQVIAFAFDAPAALPVPGGTLLCGGQQLFLRNVAYPGNASSATARLAVPALAALEGFTFCAQALIRPSGAPAMLTNALDVRIGGCACPSDPARAR